MVKLHKLATIFAYSVISIFGTSSLNASELLLSAGYFNLNTKTSTQQAVLDNIGLFRIAYSLPIGDHFAIQPGYSFYVLGSSNIDLGYGLDFGLVYYPFTLNRSIQASNQHNSWKTNHEWKPYLVCKFAQRQFQSIQSSYAGVSIQFGSSYQWSRRSSLFGHIGMGWLNGPFESRIIETTLEFGIARSLN